MSYCVDFRGGEFRIDRSRVPSATKALMEYRRTCGYTVEPDATLVSLLSDCCWGAEVDADGNITYIYLDDDRLGDEEDWFKVIAPYVDKRSHLVFEGEDGHIWCYYFDGQTCTEHAGVIMFPTIEYTNETGEVAICT